MVTDYYINNFNSYLETDTDYRFNCPFCDDGRDKHKLYVSKEDDLWHCFNCGRSGTLTSFIKQYEGIPYSSAYQLSQEYGGQTASFNSNSELTDTEKLILLVSGLESTSVSKQISASHLLAAPTIKGFKYLMDHTKDITAYPYFYYCYKRGFTEEDIIKHHIGYVDRGVFQMPSGKTIQINYSLVFTTKDFDNQPIYWNTRSIEANPYTKSFNCPEFKQHYSKKTCIFNFNNAYKCAKIVITEGVPDSLTIGASGIGTFGKQVTQEQVDLILSHISKKQKLYIMLDMDAKKEIIKLANKLYPYHHETYIVINPTNHDANDLGKDKAWDVINTQSVRADNYGILKLRLT